MKVYHKALEMGNITKRVILQVSNGRLYVMWPNYDTKVDKPSDWIMSLTVIWLLQFVHVFFSLATKHWSGKPHKSGPRVSKQSSQPTRVCQTCLLCCSSLASSTMLTALRRRRWICPLSLPWQNLIWKRLASTLWERDASFKLPLQVRLSRKFVY